MHNKDEKKRKERETNKWTTKRVADHEELTSYIEAIRWLAYQRQAEVAEQACRHTCTDNTQA